MTENHRESVPEDEKNAFKSAGLTQYSTGTDRDVPRHRHQRRSSDFSTQQGNASKETLSETDRYSRSSDGLNGSMVSIPSRQHIANVALQISAIVAAIAFGAFAVQSVHLANDANHYAATAANLSLASNQMAMYAICISIQLQNASLPPFCDQVFAESQKVLPGIASVLFSTHQESYASEPLMFFEPTQTNSANITASSTSDGFSLTTFASTVPAAATYTSVVTTRKLDDHVDDPFTDSFISDSTSTNLARHNYALLASIIAPILLLLMALAGLFTWRYTHRRQAVKYYSSMRASHRQTGKESNHLLAAPEWVREIYGLGGPLHSLAKENQRYEDNEAREGALPGHGDSPEAALLS
ncbi:MAG: hypothetical protein Q9195_003258 [Heterodermia aff. obscurata]